MKKTTLLAGIVLFFLACKKDNDTASLDCINDKIEDFKQSTDAIAIKTIKSNGELVFWLQSDMTDVADGGTVIWNEKCEVVCQTGFRYITHGVNCPDFASPDWEIIWEK